MEIFMLKDIFKCPVSYSYPNQGDELTKCVWVQVCPKGPKSTPKLFPRCPHAKLEKRYAAATKYPH